MTLLQSTADNARSVVACDMEGTLSAGQAWLGMRQYLLENGQRARYNRFVGRNIGRFMGYRLGLIDGSNFKERWLLGFLGLFAGMTRAEFDGLARYVAETQLWPQRRQPVVDELLAYQRQGYRVVVVTGLFEPMLAHLLTHLPGVEGIGTPLHFDGDRFSGRIVGSLNVGPRKVAQLQPFARDGKIAVAYGDTLRDVPMLEMAIRPIAVHPDRRLHDLAKTRQWRIIQT